MITVQYLLEMAIAQEALYKKLSEKFPPGTISRERGDAYQNYQHALIAADWMEKNKIEKLHHVGPFTTRVISKSDEIIINQGALIMTTHPKGNVITTKKQRVKTVRRIDHGYIDESNKTVVNPRVVWAGAGGYWRWTDINNVDLAPTSTQVEQTALVN